MCDPQVSIYYTRFFMKIIFINHKHFILGRILVSKNWKVIN